MNAPRGKRQGGMTLLEALLAAVVLAMAASAVVMPYTAGARCAAQDARQTIAVNLAQDMMEEILSKSFRDPDGEAGESGRGTWDDIDDYDGYAEQAGSICSFDGAPVSDPAAVGLSRHVSAEGVYVSGQETSEPPTFVRVCVEVRYKDEGVIALNRLVYANDP